MQKIPAGTGIGENIVMKILDGSVLEGGGQILRNAAALSAITGQIVRVENVRGKRSRPGLRPQHKTGLDKVAEACGGQLQGCEIDSTSVQLYPGKLHQNTGDIIADIGTAGSCALIAQAVVPCLLMAGGHSHIICKGGTDAAAAPPADFLLHILQPYFDRIGLDDVNFTLKKRGFFPKGGGELTVSIKSPRGGASLDSFQLTNRGELTHIEAKIWTAGKCGRGMGRAIWQSASKTLSQAPSAIASLPQTTSIVKLDESEAVGSSAGVLLIAHTSQGYRLSASSQLDRKRGPEEVGALAAQALLKELGHGGCVDEYVQDQLIIFMALAAGVSVVQCGPISLHTKTAMWVASEILGVDFSIAEGDENVPFNTITCRGAGVIVPVSPIDDNDSEDA